MLIDLEFSLDETRRLGRVNHQWITEFNTDNGGLVTTYKFPPELLLSGDNEYSRHVHAERVNKGVYWGSNFHNTILSYTKWNIEYLHEKSGQLWDRLEKTPEGSEKDLIRTEMSRLFSVPEYGSADNLKQVFTVCRKFVSSHDPYVLSLNLVTQATHHGWRWHKNGPYIGRHKHLGEHFEYTPEIDNIISFQFHKLILNENVKGKIHD